MMCITTPSKHTISFSKAVLLMVLAIVLPCVIFQGVLMLMYVPSDSMAPTMANGDCLIGCRLAPDPQRGDIVVFQAEALMIKRVVGLPGEEVLISPNGEVYIDKVLLEEPYVVYQRKGQEQTFQIPDGCFLLLGDNRQHSYDARYWDDPYIPREKIIAVAKYKIGGGCLE